MIRRRLANRPQEFVDKGVALLQAARDANVGSLEITSGWRPMTGKASDRVKDARAARDLAKQTYSVNHKGSFAETFEKALFKNPLIRQVFEPLVMDANTRDKVEREVNRYLTSNETTHKIHLHVTAVDTYLTP
jgi:hypothetical protein